MLACAIIDALDWPRDNDSYDRAKSILDRLDPLTGNLCKTNSRNRRRDAMAPLTNSSRPQ